MANDNLIKQLTTNLFRYDITCPPESWDNEYKNPIYDYGDNGIKNIAGLFFFTDSCELALKLGKSESQKGSYYLTSCSSNTTLNIIDFCDCNSIFEMIQVLDELGIDVLNKSFNTYAKKSANFPQDFAFLRPIFHQAINESNALKKLSIVQKIKIDSGSNCQDISLFGQRLTDFKNGINFKNKVTKLHPNVDGYRWREFNEPDALTYCLFDSVKLGKTKRQTIQK